MNNLQNNEIANAGDPTGGDICADEHGAPLYTQADLDAMQRAEAPEQLTAATRTLLDLVSTAPTRATAKDVYGRFELSDGADGAKNTRALFRLCRTALDFLESDLRACEARELEYHAAQAAAFEALAREASE